MTPASSPDASLPADAQAADAAGDATLPGTPTWAIGVGDSGLDVATSVVVDSDGSIVVAGEFVGSIDVGTRLTSAGLRDLFLLRRGPNGTPRAATRFGSTAEDTHPFLARLPGGGFALAATFEGMTDLGNHTAAGPQDGLLAVLTASFARVWSTPISGFYRDWMETVAADASGNVVASGAFAYNASIGTAALVGDGLDGHVEKLSSDGTFRWARGIGGGTGINGPNQVVTAVALDDAGSVYATGFFEATADVGGTSYTSLGQYDVFIAKWDPDGRVLWTHAYGGGGPDSGLSLAVDAGRNVYVGIQSTGMASFGGAPISSTADFLDHAVIVKYDTSGAFVWQAELPASVRCMRAAADGLHLAGAVKGTFDLGGGVTAASAGGTDALVAHLGYDGAWTAAHAFGGTLDDEARSVAVAPDGADVIAGSFQGTATFGGTALSSAGGSDAFIARLAP